MDTTSFMYGPVVRISGAEGVMAASAIRKLYRWDNPFTRTVGRLIDRTRVYPRPQALRYGMLCAMPELPEVERGRRIAMRVVLGRRITEARCTDDPIVFEGVPASRFRKALLGRRVLAVKRHTSPGGPRVKLKSSAKRPDGAWPPRFTKLQLVFDDGGELIVADARRLGRIRLRHDPAHEPPISLLGFDAHRALPPFSAFRDLVRQRGAPLKALLLDQSFAAGVGNWIADEVLYQARLDPRRRANTLADPEIARMRAALKRVIDTSVRLSNDSDRYPSGWLFHRRWGKNPRAVTRTGERIRHITLGGRTTAWVPTRQR
jgi:formamidopyrimidine-DNA glycosylase